MAATAGSGEMKIYINGELSAAAGNGNPARATTCGSAGTRRYLFTRKNQVD